MATLKRLLVYSVLLPAALALTAILIVGCGEDHRSTVEDTVQNSLNNLDPPQRAAFPIGAGPPRVKENSCRKIRAPAPPAGRLILPGGSLRSRPPRPPEHLAFWSCVVRFAHVPFRLRVALEDNGKIFEAFLMPRQSLNPGTATTYEGGPKQSKP